MNREKFTENLRSAREARDLTQKQVAEALGISDRTYSKWETGETEPGIELLCRLAETYGMRPGDFFAEKAPKEGSPVRAELMSLTPVQAMLRAREIMDEAYDGLYDNALLWNQKPYDELVTAYSEPLPIPHAPEQLMNGFCCYGSDDEAFFLRSWDADTDLRLLLMPSEKGFDWLKEERAALKELFRALSNVELLEVLFQRPPKEESIYTTEYLSKETGLPPERIGEIMRLFSEWKLTGPYSIKTAEGRLETWFQPNARYLRAIVTLAHLLIRG